MNLNFPPRCRFQHKPLSNPPLNCLPKLKTHLAPRPQLTATLPNSKLEHLRGYIPSNHKPDPTHSARRQNSEHGRRDPLASIDDFPSFRGDAPRLLKLNNPVPGRDVVHGRALLGEVKEGDVCIFLQISVI